MVYYHHDLCFDDGNLALLSGDTCFMVHEGLLRRQSKVIDYIIKSLDRSKKLCGRPILSLDESPQQMALFLASLYDGVPTLLPDATDFSVLSGLLKLFTKYKVLRLRSDLLRAVTDIWPSKLSQWELRELRAPPATFNPYHRCDTRPHPILIINLAHEIQAPELLPSAFYDLSRSPPSQILIGVTTGASTRQELSDVDLLNLLRGREHAWRFLKHFILNELEGRKPSDWCQHRNEDTERTRRECSFAFDDLSSELLRDVVGTMPDYADPLLTLFKADQMQSRNDPPADDFSITSPGTKRVRRACEVCRTEFGALVDAFREEFWQKLPDWFGVHLENWA